MKEALCEAALLHAVQMPGDYVRITQKAGFGLNGKFASLSFGIKTAFPACSAGETMNKSFGAFAPKRFDVPTRLWL